MHVEQGLSPTLEVFPEYSSVSFSCYGDRVLFGAKESTCIGGRWTSSPPWCGKLRVEFGFDSVHGFVIHLGYEFRPRKKSKIIVDPSPEEFRYGRIQVRDNFSQPRRGDCFLATKGYNYTFIIPLSGKAYRPHVVKISGHFTRNNLLGSKILMMSLIP